MQRDTQVVEDLSNSDKMRRMEPLTVTVQPDAFTTFASKAFDYEFNGTSTFFPFEKPNIPDTFKIGVIVGPSGSGKTLLLKEFGEESQTNWTNDKAIISHFSSPETGINLLSGVGFNTIPAWMRPYHVLSTGERFRADLARHLDQKTELILVDEFTSTVDRNVAKAASRGLRRMLDKNTLTPMILATCHYDILDWLEPDWVFDTMRGKLTIGRFLYRRPEINLEIHPCHRSLWGVFKKHHYLTSTIANNARCFAATWNGNLVGFASSMSMPCGSVKNGWREHRTVVLPDYQGMGIGPRLSDAVAQIHLDEGKRYFSRTAHPRFGAYRDASPKWKKTSKYRKLREDAKHRLEVKGMWNAYNTDFTRVCYSHEYIG